MKGGTDQSGREEWDQSLWHSSREEWDRSDGQEMGSTTLVFTLLMKSGMNNDGSGSVTWVTLFDEEWG
jgi:hypothetical protein